ncbi:MAG TPA: glycosyltransferase N-terminal domain-containing protein [Longimicrobiales bacterium]|nr:glycosyltransferase N-terminal domain-containing protein [Longimicrobiales bacterium]
MGSVPLPYRVTMHALRALAPLLARGGSKVARGVAGRRAARAALVGWAARARDPARPAVWLHAPSVGEALQGGAVLQALAHTRPGLQVAFTHFSPSAERTGARLGADVSAYVPWDVSSEVGPVLDALRPDAVVFTKTEVWPVLVAEAARRGVPAALVAGTVPLGAGRASRPARALLRSTWERLALACAVGPEDAAALRALGVPEAALHVTGDPAVDAAAARAAVADPAAPHLAAFRADPRPTLVAGSTWPADEAALLPALARARRSVPALRAVLAPHEPTGRAVEGLLGRLEAAGWRAAPLAAVEAGGAAGVDAVVVERTGVLADLYSVADVAYVGGGFGSAGLHSVLEPAAVGAPVLFGPRHASSRAAAGLIAAGAAAAAADAADLARTLATWLLEPATRKRLSERAFAYIGEHRGAAVKTARLLEPLLGVPGAP